MKAKKKKLEANPFMIGLMGICGIISKISLSAFALCFIYLTLVFWGDSIRNLNQMTDRNYYYTVIKNILFLFKYSAFGIIIFTSIINFGEIYYSKIICFLGAVFAYGLPYIFVEFTNASDFANVPFLGQIVYTYSYVGKICLALGIILLVRDLIDNIKYGFSRLQVSSKNKVKSIKRSGKVGNHCWDSGYCTKELREVCPAFAMKKSCWKVGVGCCDPTLFLFSSKSDYAKRILEEGGFDEKVSIASCKKCHIYLVHQRRKYKTLLPIMIIISLIIGYGVYYYCWNTFEKAIISVDKFARFLVPNSGSITNMKGALFVLVAFLVLVSIVLVMSLMVQLLHYCIFKLKL